MPASDSVAQFIARNNATIDGLEELLTTATDQALPAAKRTEALGTAGHKACLALKRLYEADQQLWEPLEQQQPRGYLDADLVLHLVEPEQYPTPRAPVPPELFELFHHPRPDEANDLIQQANGWLKQAVAGLPKERDVLSKLIEQARRSVDELRVETCQLVNAEAPRQNRIRMIRDTIKAIAMASLGAAAADLQQGAWRVAPDVLHRTAEALQPLDRALDSLPVLWLLAIAALAQTADVAVRTVRASRNRRTDRTTDRRPGDRDRARPRPEGKTSDVPRSRARAGRGHRPPDEDDKGRPRRERPSRGGER
jgi:hypothetical protein